MMIAGARLHRTYQLGRVHVCVEELNMEVENANSSSSDDGSWAQIGNKR